MNFASELLLWLTSADPSPVAHRLTLMLALLLTAAGVLVHRSFTFPGPLSRAEREAARGSRLRRAGAVAVYWATAMACIAALVLLAVTPRQPRLLLLESRAQSELLPNDESGCPPLGLETREVGFREYPPGVAIQDLGPLVDEVTQRCGDACVSYGDTITERARLASLVKHVVLTFNHPAIEGPHGVSSGLTPDGDQRFPRVDRAVIETIEVSVIQLALARFNAREVRVLPGNSHESQASWDVAGTMLKSAGAPFRLCGTGASRLPSQPVITRLTELVLSPDRQLSGWALVQGRFPPGVAHHSIGLSIEAWGAARPDIGAIPSMVAGVSIPADSLTSRLVRLCFGPGCPSTGPQDGFVSRLQTALGAARGQDATLRLRTDRSISGLDVWTPIRIDSDRPPEIRVTGGWPSAWERFLQQLATAPRYEAFRAELSAMGLGVPTLVASSSGDRVPVLAWGKDWLTLGLDQASVQRAQAEAGIEPALRTATESRIRPGNMLKPSTVFSLVHLTARPILLGLAPNLGTLATVERGAGDGLGDTPVENRDAIIREGQESPGRPYLVVGMEGLAERLDPASPRFEPATALALVRTMTWAAQRVKDGASGTSPRLSAQRNESSLLARPLMTSADVREAARAGLKLSDASLLALLGVCLLVTSVTLVRRAPEQD